MRRLHIALDVEGVLADSHTPTALRSDLLTRENCPPHHYDFESEEHYQEYMHVSQNLWHNHHEQIPAVPQQQGWDIGWATERLSKFHDVDILTSRTGVDDQIQRWLDSEGVVYDDFIVTDGARTNKTEYGEHDVHIEDSPNVAQDALKDTRTVFLVEQPYNGPEHVETGVEYAHRLYRVADLSEAVDRLCDPHWFVRQKALVGPQVADAA